MKYRPGLNLGLFHSDILFFNNSSGGRSWVVQWVECLTLGLSSSHDQGHDLELRVKLHAERGVCLRFCLSLPLSPASL